MIKSMTGFGRCEIAENSRKFTVEIKSVNHRYLDVNIKIPKAFNFFESAVRSELKKYISRGKVDVFISCEDFSEKNSTVHYNREIAAAYLKYINQMAEEFQLENDLRVSMLSRFPEVFTMEETDADEDELWLGLQKAVTGAAEMFVDTRVVEGGHLRDDLIGKLDGMMGLVDAISERAPRIIEEYRRKLEERVRDLMEDVHVDESRLVTEVTIFADKVCVIAQEMNREANTILSKASDLETSNYAIELKTEIEKVREQIQNIE